MVDGYRDQLQSALGQSYTIERELAGGGMSRVFVAHDTTLNRSVVVKTLSPDFAASVSADRFRREILLAASLQQANIVPVLSAGECDGLPYYTMPYVEGESLRALLSTRGALPIREILGILRDVARALAFAHGRGVVHRDIKPENVLLSATTAVVTDFGIAKALESSRVASSATALTQMGSVIGTPTYMAPEQVAGDPNIDHRADVYSFGILAYELLAGAPPFSNRSTQALLAAHIAEPPAPIAGKRPDTPGAVATLVMRCLEKDPERRPQSGAEIIEALEAVTAVASARAKPSIGVLPFANLSPDPADEFFADGLTDEIITDLAPIHGIHVIARASMMRFKGTNKDPMTVARELGVRYVLDGSVRRAGNSLRLTVRLIDTSSDTTIWSDKLGGLVEDVFAMQERVSRTIVDALQVTLSPREEQQLVARPIADLQAYESFLQARQLLWTFTAETLERALKLLEAAESRIGPNARLIAAEGNVHLNFLETGHVDVNHHLAVADRCADRLEVLDPGSSAVHALRGAIRFRRGQMREAIASLTRARALEPNNSDIAVYLCYAHILTGRDDAAAEMAAAVIALDPLTPLFQCMPGYVNIVAGRPAEGVGPYRRYRDMDPANPVPQLFLTSALLQAGERAEASEVATALAAQFPGSVLGKLGDAYACALRGDRDAGMSAMTDDVRVMAKHSVMFATQNADVFALLDAPEEAIDALEDAVRLGYWHYPFLARRSPVLAPLRGHPRFQALLEIVRAQWERGETN